jgi:hypothetical protein
MEFHFMIRYREDDFGNLRLCIFNESLDIVLETGRMVVEFGEIYGTSSSAYEEMIIRI